MAEHDWTAIDRMAADVERVGGTVGIAIRRSGHVLYARQAARRFRAASTIKIPIMIAVYRAIESGALSPDDRHVLGEAERTPGSGVLSQLHAGIELTVADLLYLMIAISDNTATNLLLERVRFAAVNATMRELGMADSILGRPMLGRLPDEGAPDNWTTAHDLALVLEGIVSGTAASAETCARMMATLEQQRSTLRLGRFLSEEAGLRWGSKPGSLPGLCHDAGFVATAGGTLSLAVCTENLPDLDSAERTIGEIAREAVAVAG